MAGMGMLAAISPQWAQRMRALGGSDAARDTGQALPGDDEDDVLKRLAGEVIQPYRPGWGALPGVGASIVGGMAAAKLRENNAVRQRADNAAWDGYIRTTMGGMAAPGWAPPPPQVAPPSPARMPASSAPAPAAAGGAVPPTLPDLTPTAEQMGFAGSSDARPPDVQPDRSLGLQAGSSPMTAAAAVATGSQDPRLTRYERELQALMPMLKNPGTRAFAIQRLQAIEAARNRVDDPDAALERRLKEAQLKKLEAGEQTFDLAEGHKRYQMVKLPDGSTRVVEIASGGNKLDSTARKAIYEAQDELPNMQSSVETLREAKSLLPQIMTGYTANARAGFNQAMPSWLPNIITSPEAAKATQRYNQIMTAEAIAAMSQSLKGATTDNEMRQFVSIMNDQNTAPEVKARMLDTMIARAESHYRNRLDRIQELGGRVPNVTSSPAPQATGDGEEKAVGGKTYIKRGGQWYEK